MDEQIYETVDTEQLSQNQEQTTSSDDNGFGLDPKLIGVGAGAAVAIAAAAKHFGLVEKTRNFVADKKRKHLEKKAQKLAAQQVKIEAALATMNPVILVSEEE